VRDDSGVYEGAAVSRFYDTLLAKLIVWGADRPAAVARMARALGEYKVVGVRTTLPVLERIIAHDDFRAGRLSTGFLERLLPGLTPAAGRHASVAIIAAALAQYEAMGRGLLEAPPAPSPWRWRPRSGGSGR
jgi:3-methylcrotonyl-CoA carboxylase alpha subunit